MQWYDATGGTEAMLLGFPAPAGAPTPGRTLGAIRSDDVELSSFESMRCAWAIVTIGDTRPCTGSRYDAMAEVQPAIHRAFDELRLRAGQAGANVAADVRCFAYAQPAPHVWCEGSALVPDPKLPERVEVDPSEPTDVPPATAASRFAIASDGGVTMLGHVPAVSADLWLRYRPLAFAFDVLDLHDGTGRGLVGVGALGFYRIALPREGFDAIVGGGAAGIAANGAVNPTFHGLFQAFAGVLYQTPWRLAGVAQPYIQLRVGVAHAGPTVLDRATVPIGGLVIGLSSTER